MSTSPMTLAQFCATREACANLSAHPAREIRDQYLPEDHPAGAPAGFVYEGSLVVEDHRAHPIQGNDYYLLIGNLEWLSNDLGELEAQLYEFYRSECAPAAGPEPR